MKAYCIFTTFAILLASCLTLTSCSKEKDSLAKNSEILTFKNFDEFSQVKENYQAMNPSEQLDWERTKGFTSFGTLCYQIYEQANPENFSTQEELIEFVNNNKEYIYFIEKNGELTLEPRLYDNFDRYFINSDRMIQIGSEFFKIQEDRIITGSVNQYTNLKETKEELSAVVSKNQLKSENLQKTTAYGLSDSYEVDKTAGRDRICITVNLKKKTLNQGYKASYIVRPYKKTLGIWYHCTRSISHFIKTHIAYYDHYGKFYSIYFGDSYEQNYSSPVSKTEVEWHLNNSDLSFGSYKDIGFTALKCWASSPSVPGGRVELNVDAEEILW